MLFIFIIR